MPNKYQIWWQLVFCCKWRGGPYLIILDVVWHTGNNSLVMCHGVGIISNYSQVSPHGGAKVPISDNATEPTPCEVFQLPSHQPDTLCHHESSNCQLNWANQSNLHKNFVHLTFFPHLSCLLSSLSHRTSIWATCTIWLAVHQTVMQSVLCKDILAQRL